MKGQGGQVDNGSGGGLKVMSLSGGCKLGSLYGIARVRGVGGGTVAA